MRRISIVVSAGLIAFVVAACSTITPSSNEGPDMTSNDSWRQLDHPETAEALLARLKGTVEEIGRIVAKHAPEMTAFRWSTTEGRRGGLAGCGDLLKDKQFNGAFPSTGSYYSDSPIPDLAWPAALAEVTDLLAREYSAVPDFAPQNSPGNYDVRFASPDGFTFAFGSKVATSVDGAGPCRRKAGI
ncbi:MAG: LppA family lipoprotein [Gordonia sp. (in: high G+C Gram-positive bacteria)]|uniref:LppA family lipoprotein n=1 Tax=Gordonia sp. (in: high G+C Gram-positive bacteria) TaxID=84139 RepID=UPI003C759DB5